MRTTCLFQRPVESEPRRSGHLRGQDVRRDADDPTGADGDHGQGERVVPAQDDEPIAHRLSELLSPKDVPRRLLDRDDVWRRRADARERLGGEVDARTRGNVVDDDRDAHARRDLDEVAKEASLRRLVVIGNDDHHGVDASALGVLSEPDSLPGRVRACARDNLGAPACALDGTLDDLPVLVVRKGGALAGRATRDEPVHAGSDLGIDEGVERSPVDRLTRLVMEGRDERRIGSLES